MEKRTFVTYISNDRDYKGVLLLDYNLKRVKSLYNLVCIVLEDVSEDICEILEHNNIVLHKFNLRDILTGFQFSNENINHLTSQNYYGKFIMHKLIMYDKIVYLDTDVMIMENIDSLFDKECSETTLHMAYDLSTDKNDIYFHKDRYNSGVIITRPNNDVYRVCYSILKAYERCEQITVLHSDQNIYNRIMTVAEVPIDVIPLEYRYNCVAAICKRLIDKELLEKPVIIHFILHPKPWNYIDINMNVIDKYYYSDVEYYTNYWLNMYYEFVTYIANKGFSKHLFYKSSNFFLKEKWEVVEEITKESMKF